MLKLFFKIPYAKELYCLAKYDQEFSSVMMYMFGSSMGCFYNMEWFSLLLFNLLLQKMDVLKNILMAITTNLKMLGMLSLLGIYYLIMQVSPSSPSSQSSPSTITPVLSTHRTSPNSIASL